MTTPDVTGTIVAPSGFVAVGTKIRFRLVASSTVGVEANGFTAGGTAVGGTTWAAPNKAGVYTFVDVNPIADPEAFMDPPDYVAPTDDAVTVPEGAVYQVVVIYPDGSEVTEYHVVPDHEVGPIELGAGTITDAPDGLPPAGSTNARVGGDASGTVGNITINADALPNLADAPPGTEPVPSGVFLLGIEAGGVVSYPKASALVGATVDFVSNVAAGTILGRAVGAGAGDSQELTAAQAWTVLGQANPTVLTVATSTASDGKVSVVASAALFSGGTVLLFGDSSHAQPRAALTVNGVVAGPGGSSAVDFRVERTGVAAGQVTGSLAVTSTVTATGLTAASGTASDGRVVAMASSFLGGGFVSLFGNTADANPKAALAGNGVSLGAGGASATDVSFTRSGTNAATITATSGLTVAGNLTLSARNIITDTSTGLKIGTATTQKLGFWNKTPIVQPTTGITGAAFVANAGTAVNDASTFGGYTLAKIAAALINTGILA